MSTLALGRAMYKTLLGRWAIKLQVCCHRMAILLPACHHNQCMNPGDFPAQQNSFPCAFQDAPIKDAKHTGIILCGQPEMGEAVKKLVISQGVQEDLILTNF